MLPRSSASQKRLTWTENRQGFLEVDASSSLPSPFIFPPVPEKKVPLSRATRRGCSHEVRATWLGLNAKVIKVVDRPPHGERFEDRKSLPVFKGTPTRPLQTPWGEHVRRQPGPFLKAKEISTCEWELQKPKSVIC